MLGRLPEINGAVERCNSSWRYEFYAVYDLPTRLDELNPLIDAFQHRYNTWRPHRALGSKTPAQYLQARQANEPPRSHMFLSADSPPPMAPMHDPG